MTVLHQVEMNQNCGSLLYKAPEVMQMLRYSESSDIWSMGLIAHMLVTGMTPWQGDSASSIAAPVCTELTELLLHMRTEPCVATIDCAAAAADCCVDGIARLAGLHWVRTRSALGAVIASCRT